MHYMSFFPEFLKDYARAVSIGTRPRGGIFIKVTICKEVTLAITCFWVLQFNLAFVAGPTLTRPQNALRRYFCLLVLF